MIFCKECGKELLYKGADYCQHCGKAQFQESEPELEAEVEQEVKVVKKTKESKKAVKTEVRIIQTVPHKSPGTAALIALIGAIFGFPGIGHIYVGRIGRGIAILVSGFVLYAMIWISLFGTLLGGGFVAATGGGMADFQIGGAFLVLFPMMYFGLLIWQIFNARSVAKQHNEKATRTYVQDTDTEAA